MFRPALAILLALGWWALPAGFADEPPKKPRWSVTAECQMVTLPQKLALPLIDQWNDDTKTEAAWATLQDLLTRNEATLIGNLLVKGEAGKPLLSESVEEFRYPTGFDPPVLPDRVPSEKIAEALKNWPAVGITPTSYETRSVGTTLELKAEVSRDGGWISTSVIPQHVRLLRMTKYDAGVLASGQRLSIEQPQFMCLKNTCSLNLRPGQRVLLGVHKLPDTVNVWELFFLRVNVTRTGSEP